MAKFRAGEFLMADFFGFLKIFTVCGTVYFLVMIVLLSLPQSKLRMVAIEMVKWAGAAGLGIMCVSPVDVIPDVVPVIGWADDIGYVIAAYFTAKSAWAAREQRVRLDEAETEQFIADQQIKRLASAGKED